MSEREGSGECPITDAESETAHAVVDLTGVPTKDAAEVSDKSGIPSLHNARREDDFVRN